MSARFASRWLAISVVCFTAFFASAQTAYFADGYHGGVYGHYPTNFTQFMVDSLRAHPDWKLNLEIEPETWDMARTNTPDAYAAFKELAADQSANGRVEFVNPAYGQAYLWNISGESIIQQFDRGIAKIREHVPNAQFTTYSSEEPCFTSALPGILKSFGFNNAVLKNPNTCWGGYTRAFGGELVNWIGPDGTSLPTVPRYEVESLKPGSTWETIACANTPAYIEAALAAHIGHPIGMCLQDAGWRHGPWLDHVGRFYQPSVSTLWRNYFENVATNKPAQDWRFSQEDVQVSLVWGAQVLQQLAQQVRRAENQIVMAEKMATLAGAEQNLPWPEGNFDEAWRTLMLAQHHDCWIVPYNGRPGNTWADKVARWTDATIARSGQVVSNSLAALAPDQAGGTNYLVRVFNTLGQARTNLVQVTLSAEWGGTEFKLTDFAGNEIAVQRDEKFSDTRGFDFIASVPPFGFNTYRLDSAGARPCQGAAISERQGAGSVPKPSAESMSQRPGTAALRATVRTNTTLTLESDGYKIVLDAAHGGTIQSLLAKKLGGRELVDRANPRRFNEVRGYFTKLGRFASTAELPAKIEMLENGPVRVRVRITGIIQSNVVTQTLTLVAGEPRIDYSVRIDWQDRLDIGADPAGGFRREQDRKAFYDDRYKLLVLFPLNLAQPEIFKDAPFDVTASRLTNTFFENWSDIKNNVILNWVDVFDRSQDTGTALLTDHTTSFAHGADHPLALTLQYSGVGLWGRDYSLNGATEVHYALLPHAGNWQDAALWTTSKEWSEPLVARIFRSADALAEPAKSLVKIEEGGWEIPTARLDNGNVIIRLFNPSASASEKKIHYGGKVSKADLVQLNGKIVRLLAIKKSAAKEAVFTVALPAFGIGTLRITP